MRAIDLPFIVGGDLNLAAEVLEQSGWLHAQRARTVAPSNETPTCLDSTDKGRVIDFFVSEELHPVIEEVAVDDRPRVICTHQPVVLALEGVQRGRLVPRLRRPANNHDVHPTNASSQLFIIRWNL